MDPRTITPAQVRRAGLDALGQALRPVGMLLFGMMGEIGS